MLRDGMRWARSSGQSTYSADVAADLYIEVTVSFAALAASIAASHSRVRCGSVIRVPCLQMAQVSPGM